MTKVQWQMNKQCDECPWRKDSTPGQFSLERYKVLRQSVQQGFGKLFACHKSPCENTLACAGYVMNQVKEGGDGPQNFNLRLAIARRRIQPEKMTLVGEQYESFEDMVDANRIKVRKRNAVQDTTCQAAGGQRDRRTRNSPRRRPSST